jgi:hypothetical protein
MKRRKLYRYVGRNGTITSPIFLEDIKHIPLVELKPEIGYALTDGIAVKKGSIIVHVEEADIWTEVKLTDSEIEDNADISE